MTTAELKDAAIFVMAHASDDDRFFMERNEILGG
jgi:hypothetical protein